MVVFRYYILYPNTKQLEMESPSVYMMRSSRRLPDGDIVLPGGGKRVRFRPREVYLGVDASHHRFPERPSVVEVLSQETETPRLSQLNNIVFKLKTYSPT